MKKGIIAALMLLSVAVSRAQDHQPPSPEEHLKKVTEVFQRELQLNANQLQKVQDAFKQFMESAMKLHDQNPPPPPPPMDPKVKEQFDKLVAERDERIKAILTDEQFKKYLDVEKKMRPQHPGGPGGKQGNDHPAPPATTNNN